MPRKPPPEAQQPAPARIPLGEPLEWDDADLERLAAVTPQDVAAGKAWAGRNAAEEDAPLWQAAPKPEGAP